MGSGSEDLPKGEGLGREDRTLVRPQPWCVRCWSPLEGQGGASLGVRSPPQMPCGAPCHMFTMCSSQHNQDEAGAVSGCN